MGSWIHALFQGNVQYNGLRYQVKALDIVKSETVQDRHTHTHTHTHMCVCVCVCVCVCGYLITSCCARVYVWVWVWVYECWTRGGVFGQVIQ